MGTVAALPLVFESVPSKGLVVETGHLRKVRTEILDHAHILLVQRSHNYFRSKIPNLQH